MLLLASVLYRECWIRECISKNYNHSSLKIPIINDNKLLNELKNKMCVKPSNAARHATDTHPRTETVIVMHEITQVTA